MYKKALLKKKKPGNPWKTRTVNDSNQSQHALRETERNMETQKGTIKEQIINTGSYPKQNCMVGKLKTYFRQRKILKIEKKSSNTTVMVLKTQGCTQFSNQYWQIAKFFSLGNSEQCLTFKYYPYLRHVSWKVLSLPGTIEYFSVLLEFYFITKHLGVQAFVTATTRIQPAFPATSTGSPHVDYWTRSRKWLK